MGVSKSGLYSKVVFVSREQKSYQERTIELRTCVEVKSGLNSKVVS